jgi:hypothetical protein
MEQIRSIQLLQKHTFEDSMRYTAVPFCHPVLIKVAPTNALVSTVYDRFVAAYLHCFAVPNIIIARFYLLSYCIFTLLLSAFT